MKVNWSREISVPLWLFVAIFGAGMLYGLICALVYFLFFAHPWQVPGANG